MSETEHVARRDVEVAVPPGREAGDSSNRGFESRARVEQHTVPAVSGNGFDRAVGQYGADARVARVGDVDDTVPSLRDARFALKSKFGLVRRSAVARSSLMTVARDNNEFAIRKTLQDLVEPDIDDEERAVACHRQSVWLLGNDRTRVRVDRRRVLRRGSGGAGPSYRRDCAEHGEQHETDDDQSPLPARRLCAALRVGIRVNVGRSPDRSRHDLASSLYLGPDSRGIGANDLTPATRGCAPAFS